MKPSICFHLGGFTSFNVQSTLRNIGKILSDEYDLCAVSTSPSSFPQSVHRHFSFHGAEYPASKLGGLLALRDYTKNNEPDVLTQVGDVPVYGNSISLLKSSSTKFVCRYSGDLFYEYRLEQGTRSAKLFILKNVFGRLPLHSADQVIAMGPRMKAKLADRGYNSHAIGILPPPIDRSRFKDPGKPESLPALDDGPVALFVGRLSRLKGAKTLEGVIPEVLDRNPKFQFVLVGPREYDLQLSNQYVDRVHMVGSVPPSVIPGYMHRADLYIHPSLTEGVSRSVLEALACKTPVIVRDVGDLASVTSNIFTTDDEFVKMICRYKSLPVDPIDRFTVEGLRERYIEFFDQVVQ